LKTNEAILLQIGASGRWAGRETNLESREVKGHGHVRLSEDQES